MPEFLNRALGALDRIYRFRGGQNTLNAFDLAGAVQPVHDLSREAELSAGFPGNGLLWTPGYWMIGPQHTHVGADTQRSATNPRSVIRSSPTQFGNIPADEDLDVWHMGVVSAYEETGSGVITAATAAVWLPSTMPGRTAVFPILVGGFGAPYAISDPTAVASAQVQGASSQNAGRPFNPIPLPYGSILANLSVSSAATTVTIAHLVWAGMKGVRPPGVA